MAHWAPLPDPEMTDLGMSWLTPAIREMQGDRLASEHKIRFFEQGATPNLVVKGIPAVSKEVFDDLVEAMEERHSGVANAYRTLYLTAGADATVIGSNLAELDLGAVQGRNETRLSVLSRVPASLLGISEGLAGSSLNAGNFSAARRNFADTWVYPSLQDLAASLASVVKVPADAELWFDTADMPILREDAKDAADIEAVKAVTITSYVKEGFTPESAVAAVRGQDVSLLKHGGLLSVQLQPPGQGPPPVPPAQVPAALPAANGAAKGGA
jgi:phage portal protein BeeE